MARTVQLPESAEQGSNLVWWWWREGPTYREKVRTSSRRHSRVQQAPPLILKNLSKMAAVATLPKDVSRLGQEVKLFGKWETQECVLSSVG